LKDVIEILADKKYIDGGLILQPHSMRSVELALRQGFPLLPIDALKLLTQRAGFDQIPLKQRFVMGPDKGRKDEARMLAKALGCPVASAIKTRERLLDGSPSLCIDPLVLDYIRNNNCTVIAVDDEIREGGTIGGLARLLDGTAQGLKVWVVKLIAAGDAEITAIDHLSNPIIKEVIITNAVEPQINVERIKHKLKVVNLKDDIQALMVYLQENLVKPEDPSWLRDHIQTGTLLELDLAVERYK